MKKQIILCATQRCGSTMICDDLWNTGLLGRPDEYFIPWVDADIEKYDWNEQLENIIQRSSSENGVSGIKIMSDQIEGISNKMNSFLEIKEENYLKVLPKVFSDTVWVRIVRKNTIKQAISRLMAKQTDVCHIVEDKNDFFAGKTIEAKDGYNDGVKFNYHAITKFIQSIKEEELRWNEFFSTNGIQPIKVVYEDVVASPELYLEQIAEHCVSLDQLEIKPRRTKKLSNNINKEWYVKTLEMHARKLFVHGDIYD